MKICDIWVCLTVYPLNDHLDSELFLQQSVDLLQDSTFGLEIWKVRLQEKFHLKTVAQVIACPFSECAKYLSLKNILTVMAEAL